MRRTDTCLADGRELFYYDTDDAPERTAEDERALEPTVVASEIRRDPLSGEEVLLAAHRQTRTHLPPASDCPLCATTGEQLTEIPDRTAELPALAEVAHVNLQADVLRRLDCVFDLAMPYMAGWLQAPVRADREVGHLRLEIVSSRRSEAKLKYLAASESVMGAFINDVAPEQAAEMLRAAG